MKGKQVSQEAVRKIVLLLAQGKHEKEIAEEYNISPDTVYKIRDAHIEKIPSCPKGGTDAGIAKMLQDWDRARLDFLRRHGG